MEVFQGNIIELHDNQLFRSPPQKPTKLKKRCVYVHDKPVIPDLIRNDGFPFGCQTGPVMASSLSGSVIIRR